MRRRDFINNNKLTPRQEMVQAGKVRKNKNDVYKGVIKRFKKEKINSRYYPNFALEA